MRIGIVKGDYDAYGGPETLLVRLMPALRGRGVEPVPVVLLRDPASALPARLSAAAGRPAITIRWRGPQSAIAAARCLRRIAGAEGLALLHANDMRANLTAWLAARSRPRLPFAAMSMAGSVRPIPACTGSTSGSTGGSRPAPISCCAAPTRRAANSSRPGRRTRAWCRTRSRCPMRPIRKPSPRFVRAAGAASSSASWAARIPARGRTS